MNKDDAIAYLLNEMPEAKRAEFVERWFTEPELYERLRMAEAALVDDHVRGRLSRVRRHQVERFLLGSDVQLRKLEFAETLRAAVPLFRAIPYFLGVCSCCRLASIHRIVGLARGGKSKLAKASGSAREQPSFGTR